MSLFTPLQGIIGGTLIGGSTAVLLVLNGDIMGASGILSNTLINPLKSMRNPQNQWRWVYLASFCMTVHLYVNYFSPPGFFEDERSSGSDDVPIPSFIAHILGGFLVGFGTRMGNGCTTGHGICGMSRFSKRSLVATCTFTGVGMMTRYLISPLRSWASHLGFLRTNSLPWHSPLSGAIVMATVAFAAMAAPTLAANQAATTGTDTKSADEFMKNGRKTLGASLSGILFAVGLAISGMTKNAKVHDFLCLSGFSNDTFDPTLVTVLGSAILTSWAAYQFVEGWSNTKQSALTSPVCLGKDCSFAVPTNTVVDLQLAVGEALFGIGWGLTGICPGPAVFAAASGATNCIVAWMPAFVVGSYLAQQIKESLNNPKKKTA